MHLVWKYCPILAILPRFYALFGVLFLSTRDIFLQKSFYELSFETNWVLTHGTLATEGGDWTPESGESRCDRWTLRLRWRWCNKYSYLVFFSRQHFSAMAATFRSCRSSPLYHTRLKFWMELLFVLSPCAISFTWYIAIVLTCWSFIKGSVPIIKMEI